MTDWKALHRAVVEDLDSDEPRLVLADALQSVGDPRGELIAVQCELARLGSERTRLAIWKTKRRDPDWLGDAFASGDPVRLAELRETELRLLREHGTAWTAGLPQGARIERGLVEHVDGVSLRDPAPLFDRAPAMESFQIEVDTFGIELFAEPRMRQLRQLRIALGPLPDRHKTRQFLATLAYVRQFAPVGLIDDPEASHFEQVFPPALLPNLEAVELDSPGPELLAQLRERAPRLRHLFLSGYRSATPTGDDLEILELEHTRADLVTIARTMRTLRALRISQPISPEEFHDEARAIGENFPALRVLDFAGTPFNRFLQDLVAGSGLPSLTHLRLRRCHLDDAALGYLLQSPLVRRLRHLDLRDNAITDESVEGLSAARNLGWLELRDTSLTQAGTRVLRANLPHTLLRGPRFERPWS